MSTRDDPGERERLVTGHSGRMSLLLAAGVVAANLGRQSLPPLLPAIIEDLSISPARAGFALTVLWGVYALCQYPAGVFADDRSRVTGLGVGLGGMLAGFALLALAWGYPALLGAAALVGIGAAFYMLAMRTMLSDLFVSRRGQAFGLNIAAGQVGSIAAGGLAVAALAVAGWQAAFLPVVALLGGVLLALHWLRREPYRVGWVDLPAIETARRVFGGARIRRLVVAYTLVIFTWQGVLGFLPTFLQVEKGFSSAFASGGFASVFAVGLVVQPAAGALSDRLSRLPVAGGSVLVAGTGLVVLLVSGSTALVVAGIVVFATGLLGFSPVVQAYLMDVFPEDSKGGDLGAFKTVYEGLASLGPTYVGLAAGSLGYGRAFSGFVACLLASAAILFWLSLSGE